MDLAVVFTGLLSFVALGWVVMAFAVVRGMARLPRIESTPPAADADCPFISILFSARDEAEKMPQALATLLALDYPNYEIVAVNDRSSDATGRILDEHAAREPRLRVLHIRELPAGWLGKPHGLQRAYEASRGEWLVFTDADVRFAPDLLRRAVAALRSGEWDHITLLGGVDMDTFDERFILSFFMLGFFTSQQVWRVADPTAGAYCGIGSFQMLPRAVYQTIGAHQRLAMEVIDDMKLGKLVKQHKFRSGVALAQEHVAVRWHTGLAGVIRGVEKNFFAGAGFSLARVAGQVAGLLLFHVLPLAALPFTSGVNFTLAAGAFLLGTGLLGWAARLLRVSPLYGLLLSIGAVVFIYMLLRSTILTLRQGGIRWRDTFYPLEDLRKGML